MSKAWLHKPKSKEIEVMGAKIKVRNLKFGDSRSIVSKAVEVDPMTSKAKIDTSLLGALRTIASIESWDVTDEDDQVLPITLETFDSVLADEFVAELIQAVQEAIEGGMTEAEKKP